MIDRFRNDEKRTWNQGLLANSESCAMTHSTGCHETSGMPSFRHDAPFVRRDGPQYKGCTRVRHDGAFLASWRTTEQRLFGRCVTTEINLRHDGILYKGCTSMCVMTQDNLRHDASAPGSFGCSSAMTHHMLHHDGLYAFTV